MADTRYVTHDKWTSLTATQTTYPNGRQVASGYDALYRCNSVMEVSTSANIAAWQFFGGRTATVALGNGITNSFMNNAQTNSAVQSSVALPAWGDKTTDRLGYDGSGRLIAKRFLPSGSTTALVGFTTAYDPSSNKLFERALHAESRSALYPSDDSMDRLVEYQRGVLASGGGSVTTPITLPGTDNQRTYNLDGLGNRSTTVYTPEGGSSTTETRTHNKLNEVLSFGVLPASTTVLYDHGNNASGPYPSRGNGNIANDGTRIYAYDALNRLTAVSSTASGTPQVAAYTYDALGRRVLKITSNGGIPGSIANATYRYLFDNQQIVEELLYAGSSYSTLRQFIWGQYIDELIQLSIPATTTTPPLTAGTYYPLQDQLYRATATTNSSGAIIEAYDYDAYGNTLMYNGPGIDGLWFTDDDVPTLQPMCEFLFTGRQYDAETEIYWYRTRNYLTWLGRFQGRDYLAYFDTPNLYTISNSAPSTWLDPFGLQPQGLFPQPPGSPPEGGNNPITLGTTAKTEPTWETVSDWTYAFVKHEWWSGTKLVGGKPVMDCVEDENGCYLCGITNRIITWYHPLITNNPQNTALQKAIDAFENDALKHEKKVLNALTELQTKLFGPFCCAVDVNELKRQLTEIWKDLWMKALKKIEDQDSKGLKEDRASILTAAGMTVPKRLK